MPTTVPDTTAATPNPMDTHTAPSTPATTTNQTPPTVPDTPAATPNPMATTTAADTPAATTAPVEKTDVHATGGDGGKVPEKSEDGGAVIEPKESTLAATPNPPTVPDTPA
eukprot:Lankesteria_metandrocarpae@DN4149_c1_g2_i1.p1